jgi:endoglycosylceramidase
MRRWNRFSLAVAGAALAGGLLAPAGGPGGPGVAEAAVVAPAPRPTTHGRFVTLPDGRVQITHGVNMVAKLPPYRADALGFDADDAAFLRDNGFTSVRLGVIWKAVEPQPGVYDDAYLAHVRDEIALLDDYGIGSLVDFHQDLWNERYQGEGAPDWAVLDDGLPDQPLVGFPGNYFVNPALNRAFDNFYADAKGPGGIGLQERYAAMQAHVAAYLRTTPGVLGIDLFNEPWPGSTYATCIPLGCPLVDANVQRFQQKVITAVRRVDTRTPLYYEPNVLFNDGAPTYVRPTGSNLGFSFHDYCISAVTGGTATPVVDPVCHAEDGVVWGYVRQHTQATGATPLMTEFGATTNQAVLTGETDLADQNLSGWMYWAYCGCGDPTTTGAGAEQALVLDPAQPPVGANVDGAKMTALVTPYPQVTAGTPTAYRFDRTTKVFTASWSTARWGGIGTFGGGAQTRISTPPFVYPDGYTVAVTGGRVVSAANAPVLVVAQGSGSLKVTVTVTPR